MLKQVILHGILFLVGFSTISCKGEAQDIMEQPESIQMKTWFAEKFPIGITYSMAMEIFSSLNLEYTSSTEENLKQNSHPPPISEDSKVLLTLYGRESTSLFKKYYLALLYFNKDDVLASIRYFTRHLGP